MICPDCKRETGTFARHPVGSVLCRVYQEAQANGRWVTPADAVSAPPMGGVLSLQEIETVSLEGLWPAERATIRRQVERIRQGQQRYGPVEKRTPVEMVYWLKELADELSDALHYIDFFLRESAVREAGGPAQATAPVNLSEWE